MAERSKSLLIALALAIVVPVRAQQSLPAGPGSEVIQAKCVACHGTDLIVSQRLSAAGWGREIDKMVRWGVTLAPEQREALQPFLAANFGPQPSPSHTSDGGVAAAGEATFKSACLTCHGTDLVDQQRLSRAGWVREVEKMMRWGADVPAADKDALVSYLAARYPPR